MKKEFHNERNILKITHTTIVYIIKKCNDNERGEYPNKKHTYYKLLQMAQVRKNNKMLSNLFNTHQK